MQQQATIRVGVEFSTQGAIPEQGVDEFYISFNAFAGDHAGGLQQVNKSFGSEVQSEVFVGSNDGWFLPAHPQAQAPEVFFQRAYFYHRFAI